jgi:hypothetical protein
MVEPVGVVEAVGVVVPVGVVVFVWMVPVGGVTDGPDGPVVDGAFGSTVVDDAGATAGAVVVVEADDVAGSLRSTSTVDDDVGTPESRGPESWGSITSTTAGIVTFDNASSSAAKAERRDALSSPTPSKVPTAIAPAPSAAATGDDPAARAPRTIGSSVSHASDPTAGERPIETDRKARTIAGSNCVPAQSTNS